MMTSEQTSEWKVPTMKRLMNTSSRAVCDALVSPFKLAGKQENEQMNGLVQSKLTSIPGIPRFPVRDVMRRIGHLVSQWLVSLRCDLVATSNTFQEAWCGTDKSIDLCQWR